MYELPNYVYFKKSRIRQMAAIIIITKFNYRVLRPVSRFHARLSVITKYLNKIFKT